MIYKLEKKTLNPRNFIVICGKLLLKMVKGRMLNICVHITYAFYIIVSFKQLLRFRNYTCLCLIVDKNSLLDSTEKKDKLKKAGYLKTKSGRRNNFRKSRLLVVRIHLLLNQF